MSGDWRDDQRGDSFCGRFGAGSADRFAHQPSLASGGIQIASDQFVGMEVNQNTAIL
jgi:hypothetical protein